MRLAAAHPADDEKAGGSPVASTMGGLAAANEGSQPSAASADQGAAAECRAQARRMIAQIDRMIGRQLDIVIHHPALQRLEALWRGVYWLVQDGADDPKIKVRILDIRWGEVVRDLERSPTFDQSSLFDKVYSAEFGTPGGEPYGIMVVDHAVWHRLGGRERTDDVAALVSLAEVAAAAFCPFVLGVDPRVIGMDGFEEIDLRQDLAGAMSGPEFAQFERLRAQPDTRFLSLVAPRLLARPRHEGRARRRTGFVYEEAVRTPNDLLWMSGAFGLAQVAARAMRLHRWPAAIRGAAQPDEGGIVTSPARQFLPSDRAGVVARFPTENALSEEQEVDLNSAGITCLRQLHLTGSAAFLNLPSLHRPPDYSSQDAQMNAKMGAMTNYIMCVSRFAHYVKVMARDWVGKYQDARACEKLLQTWLNGYVTGNEDASPEMRVRYPLRGARVLVSEIPGKPGSYGCEIAIRPHYQLDQIASEFRLTTQIGRDQGA